LDATDLLRLGSFLTDATATAIAAWLLTCASGHASHRVLEAGLAWSWCFLALITGAGIILGELGGFSAGGFLAVHGVVLVILLVTRRHRLRDDFAALQRLSDEARAFLNRPGLERNATLALILVLAALTGIAALAETVVDDSLSYHLPRLAHWLQDREIRILDTTDLRLNFVAFLPELVAAWILGATSSGFPLLVLLQAFAGIMTVGATIGLARHSGLSRIMSLFAGAMLLGMGNLIAQFTAAQTDLFTIGLFATAFYLWVTALKRGHVSTLGVLGAGLALGAKGTVFYFGPTAVLWVIWFGWQHRLPWKQWRRTLLIAIAGILFFAGPLFLRNARAYGDPLGPAEWVKKHHAGFDSIPGLWQKLRDNLTSSLAQNFEPNSQPWGLRTFGKGVGTALANTLPEQDPYTLDNISRRHTLQRTVLDRTTPDADVTSYGFITLVLFCGSFLAAVATPSRTASRMVLGWGGGIIVFWVFFYGMHQWHPFAFRYLLLAAPWIAIVSATGLARLPRSLAVIFGSTTLLAAASVAWFITFHTHQAGWRSVVQPERSFSYAVASSWRHFTENLDRAAEPLRIALPDAGPIAGFYRQQPERTVIFVPGAGTEAQTAAQLVGDRPGWVIVPARRFLGREGEVIAQTFLFLGNPEHPASLAAYRRINPGDTTRPVLYRNISQRTTPAQWQHDVLVRTWRAGPVRLQLMNPSAAPLRYAITSAHGEIEGLIPAMEIRIAEITLPGETLTPVTVSFVAPDGAIPDATRPSVRLAAP
jgi:hypothetical protein